MRNILTPILYGVLLLPMTALAVAAEMLARSTGWLPPYTGYIDAPLVVVMLSSILLVGVPLFWCVSQVLLKIEGRRKLVTSHHIRQCICYYLISLYCIITWMSSGFSGNEEDGYLLLWLGISLIAITMNAAAVLRSGNAQA